MRFVSTLIVFTLSFALLAGLGSCAKKPSEPLLCYVGGTMRPAMEAIQKAYESKTGKKVQFDQGESGQLIVKIEQTGKGDLFVAHDPFEMELSRKNMEAKSWVPATVRPVIVVAKGNPKKITGFKSLADSGLRLIFTHPVYSTIGHIIPRIAAKVGNWEAVKKNVITEVRSGGEAANAVQIGNADAAIVWNAVAFLRMDKLDTVGIEPEYRLQKGVDAVTSATFGTIDMGKIRVTVATLKVSKQPEEAAAFAEFCASADAKKIWKDFGFCVCDREE